MIGSACHDGRGPEKLFVKHDLGQFVRHGQGAQAELELGPVQELRRQAQRSADDEAAFPDGIFERGTQKGRELHGGEQPACLVQGDQGVLGTDFLQNPGGFEPFPLRPFGLRAILDILNIDAHHLPQHFCVVFHRVKIVLFFNLTDGDNLESVHAPPGFHGFTAGKWGFSCFFVFPSRD